jgi:hypothetical protein
MYIMAAAQSYQAAIETSKNGHGLLTYALVEQGLKTDAADTAPSDGQLELREWLDYAVRQVPRLQERATTDERTLVPVVTRDPLRAQTPRTFYRPESASQIFVVAKF